MKKIYLLFTFCYLYAMDNAPYPAIVLDINIISEEQPGESSFSLDKLNTLKNFGCKNLMSLAWNHNSIIKKGIELSTSICGATNITKRTFEEMGYKFDQDKIEKLTTVGICPIVKEDGIKLIKELKQQGFSLIAATQQDPYHHKEYARYIKEIYKFNIYEIFSSVIIIPGPYDYANVLNDIMHVVASKPQPSQEYIKSICSLTKDKPALLFDASQKISDQDKNAKNSILAFHVQNAEEVKTILQKEGYLKK